MSEYIIGISAYYHDSAAALLKDGYIIGAAQEERFSRKKFDNTFPINSIKYLLAEARIKLSDVKIISFYDKPYLKFDRLFETYHAFAPAGLKSFMMTMPIWMKDKIFMRSLIKNELKKIQNCPFELRFTEHHLSHAASAFFPSPFKQAAILTIDGVGEWTTTAISFGNDNSITMLKDLTFPHSIGLLYSAFTYYCGFKVNSGEFKLMGLSPYGDPNSDQTMFFKRNILEYLLDLKPDGSFMLNLDYFDFATGTTMCKDQKWEELFLIPKRLPESKLTQSYMNLALAIQDITNEIVLRCVATAKKETSCDNLVMAGGVALNCVSNSKIIASKIFDKLWIQPAAGDAGGALGTALATWYIGLEKKRETPDGSLDSMQGSFLGPKFSEAEILHVAESYDADYIRYQTFDELVDDVAKIIAKGKVVGWFQGRMEWGPRALGNRSILGDPRSPDMQKRLNLKVKFRESFRPFAPSVIADDVEEYFDLSQSSPSPYMLLTAQVKENRIKAVDNQESFNQKTWHERLYYCRSDIPAVTHIDYSARVQTVHKETNERYWQLLNAFKKITGYGILVNTSFNVRGEPIVCSPKDAYNCFMRTEIDYLVMDNYLFKKRELFYHVDKIDNGFEVEHYINLLCCPKCNGNLTLNGSSVVQCTSCHTSYPVEDGIPRFFISNNSNIIKNDITDTIKSFYEETPFPNYDDIDDAATLILKSSKGKFAKLLNEQIPFNCSVLECGCGTGQLSNFLATAYRRIFGTDISINSLKLAYSFKENNNLQRVNFLQMNLFNPCFKPESFDVVICNGVLHHTASPLKGIQVLSKLVKPGGYILVGLYHKYGRMITNLRSFIFNLTGEKYLFLDRRNVDERISLFKREAWFKDQYKNPYETTHTISQSIDWLENSGFNVIRTIPTLGVYDNSFDDQLFSSDISRANSFEMFFKEIGMVFSNRDEGGFFIVVGRRRYSSQ